jgi:hypothetical protein
MRKLLMAATALIALSVPSFAADMAVKAVPLAPQPVLCTTNQCSVLFGGINLLGQGSNIDIIGQGVSNSIFANGGMVGGTVGGQYWNSGIFLGVENMAGWSFGSPASVNGTGVTQQGGLDVLWFEAGGSLGDLFGSGAAPVTINSALASDLISLYFGTGPAQPFGNSSLGTKSFWTSGAGARYLLPNASRPILIDFKYIYGNNQNNVGLADNKNVQFVGVGLYMPFKY